MITYITQSFIKDMQDYLDGDLCGNIIQEKWVNDKLVELDSDAAELGCYFEYILSLMLTGKGSLPKNGLVPQAGMYANGKQRLAPYELAHKNAQRVVDYMEKMGLKAVAAGVKMNKEEYEGTIDFVFELLRDSDWLVDDDGVAIFKKGQSIIIDLKYSSLIDDKWSPYGWALMAQHGDNIQKAYHGVQATQYSFIGDMPFLFLVVSSKNEVDILMLYVSVSEHSIERHLENGDYLYERFEFIAGVGFEPRPAISKCNDCPLKKNCNDKHTYPHAKSVIV